MKPTIITCLFMALFCTQIKAQTLKGRVLDSDNQLIENSYVYNSTTNSHTHTDVNGNFILEKTFVGNTIEVGILGFKKIQFIVSDTNFGDPIIITLETQVFQLEELVLRKEINAINTIAMIDLKVNPVKSSQEILRKVPGLFIGQHAGGGKAEQIFLRGFDIDHGTDLAISVDGMPVNMVSHAHGQGYSDLHFIIPETIKKINFGKGPYYSNKGDFATAGFVDFSTKTSLKNNEISVGFGDFNSFRTLGMFNILEETKKQDAYVALEYIENDGPFESPQSFNRINIFSKYSAFINGTDRVTVTASHFTSNWDASGQIPQREVANGNISRFGSIDDTEGGFTSRTNFNVEFFKRLANESILKTNIFYSKYDFELYSNFTFYLEDPINGDQIKQKEDRNIFGMNAQIISDKTYGDIDAKFIKGIGLRYDNVDDIELSHTLNRRETLEEIQLGKVVLSNFYTFFNSEFEIGDFKISPSVRLDYFKFIYNDDLQTNYQTLSKTKAIVNPKLNLLYNQNDNLQWFVKSGIGFHSNDTRVILQQDASKILPRAYGMDFGNIWKPAKKLVLNTAFWYLLSEEELVYVGDAGVIEPSGKSERVGFDLGLRYQLTDKLFFDTDATYTKARSLENIAGENYIPLAPDFTMSGGLSYTNTNGFSGAIRYRFIDDRPANEDNSIVAEGYFVSDLNINYKVKNMNFGIAIENLFDVAWNETQFATESRLQNEVASVEEIHFTPGSPFFAKATISYQF
ncbi:TonB-dependent receptor [Polaribacter sp. SA4-10]|uniref:TonB-dependent receptor n=1 Tax=Polaribacter sp. SA4-10 TaxID=754397 RepID=UPI000B3C2698|nr:TonB-dependent receptor [Polaribacter sp. SA4-10]ARV06004.1 TonB-dependent receptor [Polaribacter sp. SA4-10]